MGLALTRLQSIPPSPGDHPSTFSGQFIYTSTFIKYLQSRNHRPMKRLDIITEVRLVDVDALYSHIFSCIKDLTTTLKMHRVVFFGYWYATPIFWHLCLDEEDVHLHLSLHSIIHIPTPGTSR